MHPLGCPWDKPGDLQTESAGRQWSGLSSSSWLVEVWQTRKQEFQVRFKRKFSLTQLEAKQPILWSSIVHRVSYHNENVFGLKKTLLMIDFFNNLVGKIRYPVPYWFKHFNIDSVLILYLKNFLPDNSVGTQFQCHDNPEAQLSPLVK